jgi:hypothetical protein
MVTLTHLISYALNVACRLLNRLNSAYADFFYAEGGFLLETIVPHFVLTPFVLTATPSKGHRDITDCTTIVPGLPMPQR